MKKRIVLLVGVAAFVMVMFTGCLPGSVYDPSAHEAGLVMGLFHGAIAIFTLIGSFFNPDLAMFDANNNGFWYSVGFFLAISGEGWIFGKGKSLISFNFSDDDKKKKKKYRDYDYASTPKTNFLVGKVFYDTSTHIGGYEDYDSAVNVAAKHSDQGFKVFSSSGAVLWEPVVINMTESDTGRDAWMRDERKDDRSN